MRTLFYYTSQSWSGSARAFAVAARGLNALGVPITVVCSVDSAAEQAFAREGLEVVTLPQDGTVTGDAWRLRRVLRERFIEVVCLHTEREQLVASSAMRLAERGAVIRRIPAGATARVGRSSSLLAGKMSPARLLFAIESDRARTVGGERGFVAPLGVDVSRVDGVRAAARTSLGLELETQLIVCVTAGAARVRTATALRTLALLAERHPDLRLALVGPGSDQEDVHMHAAALGVSTLVQFLGERDDLPNVCAAADVGWVAADGDDGAFGCLDFMAARVPVISERTPLMAHYVPDGIAGVLLPPADPSDTAAAVASFLAHDEQREAMGRAGRTRAQRDFGEQTMIAGFAAATAEAGDRASWAAR